MKSAIRLYSLIVRRGRVKYTWRRKSHIWRPTSSFMDNRLSHSDRSSWWVETSLANIEENRVSEGKAISDIEDVLFDMLKNESHHMVSVQKLLLELENTGIRRTDPRLRELIRNLQVLFEETNREAGSSDTMFLDRDTFRKVVSENIVLVSRAFRHQFIIPEFQEFAQYVRRFYVNCRDIQAGQVASYIPQLARFSKDYWGVSVCTIDGQRYSIGDVNVNFTLQSISKPLMYALALQELGASTVHKYVGQEPSGRMFNELILDYNKKPHNPMINSGSIMVCALVNTLVWPELQPSEKFDYVQQYFKRLAGGESVGFNNAVFLSERDSADRNYALAYYMREHHCFPERTDLVKSLDFYFQCCSMEIHCESLSVIAASLANGGICPITGERILGSEAVRDVLSLMHSCGMYDYSGQFAFKVGLPAKSGVSGGLMLVVPNVLGMCLWSPPLDTLGNSVRGLNFCQDLVQIFNFHRYDNLKHACAKLDPRRHKYETKGLSIVRLLFSAASGDVTAMRRFYLSGMDMSQPDYDGRTALHLAAAEGHVKCVEFLLRTCQVPVNPLDRWGHTPLDDARQFEQGDVVQLLEEFQATHGSSYPPLQAALVDLPDK